MPGDSRVTVSPEILSPFPSCGFSLDSEAHTAAASSVFWTPASLPEHLSDEWLVGSVRASGVARMAATGESRPRKTQSRLLLLALFGLVAASTNQLNYQTDHQQIVEGAGDILSYFAMSDAAPGLVTVAVPYHHAQRIFLPYILGAMSLAVGLPVQGVYLLGVVSF